MEIPRSFECHSQRVSHGYRIMLETNKIMKAKIIFLSFAMVFLAAACNTSGVADKANNISDQNKQTNAEIDDLGGNDSATSSGPHITITALGFYPATLKVKAGTSVEFLNNDNKPRWPASNPHPTHTDLPGFDAGRALQPGESWSFVFDKVGTWKFHDHLNSKAQGAITVSE